ncbi:MAG: hypothetical protein KAV87_52200, partial [Desulfobacteraceae bacterium]|nr:hypothetical protein [Desulfobacteraceae bacterium]
YPAMASDVEALIKKIPVVVEDFENRDGCIFSSVEGRWKFQQSPTGQAYGPTSPKSSVALCAIPFSTGTIEYDFNITGPSYADCDILLSYEDNRNFMRVSICPYRGDSKDRVEIITNGKATQLIQREPSVRRNTWNHVRIDRNANDIRVIINGTEHLYAQCPPPAGDRFALRFWDQGLVDNFSISSSGSASHGNPFWGTIPDSDRKSELPQIDTPWKLLKEIHSLASANRYEELERHIFYRHRDQILKGIREHKPHGDFAYSNEALAEIVHNHRSEIRTLPQQYQDEFIKDWKADPTINSVANSRPDDISVFRHEQSTAYILMIKIEGEYKLIFWEDINGILRK